MAALVFETTSGKETLLTDAGQIDAFEITMSNYGNAVLNGERGACAMRFKGGSKWFFAAHVVGYENLEEGCHLPTMAGERCYGKRGKLFDGKNGRPKKIT